MLRNGNQENQIIELHVHGNYIQVYAFKGNLKKRLILTNKFQDFTTVFGTKSFILYKTWNCKKKTTTK